MSLLFEKGSFTFTGAATETVTLNNGSLTPIAIMAWSTGPGAAGSFSASAIWTQGFATRRGGSTQSGCVSFVNVDNVATSDNVKRRTTDLLSVLTTGLALDYGVTLTSFGAGQFVVTSSNTTNSSGDIFHYCVWGGSDITDAIVLNWIMDGVGATEAITGAGFQPNVILGLDSDREVAASIANINYSFGFASSNTLFAGMGITVTDSDTMTSTMNWNTVFRTDSFIDRLTVNADTSDARWDLDSFDADGATLGVVDAPTNVDRVATFLLMQGGQWEVGSKAKNAGTGNDTYTLANTNLTPTGIILFTTRQTAVGVTAGRADFCIGASDGTRQGVGGVAMPETINTTADRLHATDSVLEELTGGSSPAETSVATISSFNAGNFIINWGTNGGSSALVAFLAFGNNASAAPAVAIERRKFRMLRHLGR